MKVIINRRFGGFTLNREAWNTLIDKGEIKVTAGGNVVPIYNNSDAHDCEYLRYNQTLISMIEEGYNCSGYYSKLRVVEIPDERVMHIVAADGTHLGCFCYPDACDGVMVVEKYPDRMQEEFHIIEEEEAGIPVCSNCGAIQPEDYTVYYCWNCGAKHSPSKHGIK